MSGWTKLFSSIVTSSVWCEEDSTLRVWVAMLATSDADGVVEGSIPGFANLARVSIEAMRAAILRLSSPDPDSRTPDHEGRRIEPIEGGWRILNYAAYRERPQTKDGSKAPAMRRYRQRKRSETPEVTPGNALPRDVTGEPEARGEKREARGRTNERPSSAESSSAPEHGNGLTDGERTEYADAVWQTFLARSGVSDRIMSPAEWMVLKGWQDSGVPLRIVLRGIEDTKGRGSTLSYYQHSVKEAADMWRKLVPL